VVVGDSDRLVYLFEVYRLGVLRRMLYRGEREITLPPKAIETLIALINLRSYGSKTKVAMSPA